jgi:hypothetical protein
VSQPDRETVYAALLTLLNTALGNGNPFKTVSRTLKPINGFPPGQAPALFQTQGLEDIAQKKGQPAVRTFHVRLVVYSFSGAAGTAGIPIPFTTALNNLITAIETAVTANMATGFQQLGIPVSSCLINGKIDYFEQAATSGEWSAAIVPLEIVATY